MDSVQVTVAFIDDGVIESHFPDIRIDSYIVKEGKVQRFENCDSAIYSHATTCISIFLQYSYNPNVKIISIKILNDKKSGTVDDLIAALYWASEQKVKVVNLSLGTIYYKEAEKLLKCINILAAKGIIIVAAQNNDSLFTYPASFSNVIGVNAADDSSELTANTAIEYDGIDYSAKWAHSLNLYGKEFVTSQSNSFAAPFVTALTVKLCLEKDINDVVSAKHELNKLYKLNTAEITNFDWCVNGLVVYFDKIELCKDKLNFFDINKEIYNTNYNISMIINQINKEKNSFDTLILIFKNGKEINSLLRRLDEILCTKLVLINLDNASFDYRQINLNNISYIWFQKNISYQKSLCFDDEDIEIPVITVYGSDMAKLCSLLVNTRKDMLDDGYNCRCFLNNSLGILYDFSVINANFNKDKLNKIIQSRCTDIALIGIVAPMEEAGMHGIEPDLTCFFEGERKRNTVDKPPDCIYIDDNQKSIFADLKKLFS